MNVHNLNWYTHYAPRTMSANLDILFIGMVLIAQSSEVASKITSLHPFSTQEPTMSNITEINIPFPETEDLHLRLAVGACRIRIRPGDGPEWIKGAYEDSVNAVPLRIHQEGSTVKISQDLNWRETLGLITKAPVFDLFLGKAKAYHLTLEGGASESEIDLGGVPLRSLTVKYGAGSQEFDWSAPNPEVMEQISVSAGAANLEMENLANANFVKLNLDGGATNFELDFGGSLQRDASVKINSGMAAVELSVPASTAAKIETDAVLGSTDVGDGYMKREGAFWTEAALAGTTPTLSVFAQVVMGAISLRVR
jgi:hypothetical protein